MILVWTVENGRKTHQNENDDLNITGTCVCRPLCGMRMQLICACAMKISFPRLIFAQYKSINFKILILIQSFSNVLFENASKR